MKETGGEMERERRWRERERGRGERERDPCNRKHPYSLLSFFNSDVFVSALLCC